MNSFEYDIGEKARIGSRFISHVRSELQRAFSAEKASHKLTQQAIASKLGVHRSHVNRQLMGLENLTLRSVAELLWAIGWEPVFRVERIEPDDGNNSIVTLQRIAARPATRSASSTEQTASLELERA